MISLKELINKLQRNDRKSVFVQVLFGAIYNKMTEIYNYISGLKNEFFFDTLTEFSAKSYEKLMKITPYANANIEDRRSAIRARWRANGKNTILLIQDICNSWQNGEILAHFISGKIRLQFIGNYGIPTKNNLSALIAQINEIIPAHIGYYFKYKFLLKKDIHNVMTKKDMQELAKNNYCEVKANDR